MPGEPKCTFIAFCDLVITEAGTGKNSLIGTYPSLATPKFPLVVPQMIVHVTISNFLPGERDASIAVNIKDQGSGAVLGSRALQLPLAFQKSLNTSAANFNVNVPFQNLIFQAPRPYICEVLFDGDPIGSRVLEVRQQPVPKPPALQ